MRFTTLLVHASAALTALALQVHTADAGKRSYGCVGARANGDKITITVDTLLVTPGELTATNLKKLAEKGFAGTESAVAYRGGSFEDSFKQGATYQGLDGKGKLSLTPKNVKAVKTFTDEKACKAKTPPKTGSPAMTTGGVYKIAYELNWRAGDAAAPKEAIEQITLDCFENIVDSCR